MSKLALALSVVSFLGAGALFVVNEGLRDRVEELEDELGAIDRSVEKTIERTVKRVEREGAGRERSRVPTGTPLSADLEDRIAALESRSVAPAGARAERATGEFAGVDVSSLPEALRGPEFQSAVVAVLEARDAERRAERTRRMAEGRALMLLTGLEIDDGRRAQVVAATLDHYATREARREALPDDDRDARRALDAKLREGYKAALGAILTATEMEQVEERIDVRRRGGDNERRMRRRGARSDG